MPIGKLEPFDVNSKQWPAYVRRVRQYILLNEIRQELQVPLLITIVGDTTYSLMCDLCSPEHPESKSFEELVRLVTQHLEPQRSEIAERHVFRLRRQVVGEPLTEYLHNLKHLATTCNFGSNLEENLRDQFVSGLASEAMRSRIFAEKDINYKQAVELALALEAAERHAEVSAAPSAAGVGGGGGSAAGEGLHQASVRRSQLRGAARPPAQHGGGGSGAGGGAGGTGRCWRCGRPHRADKCRFANYNCDECGVRGHLKNMCKSVSGKGRANARHNYVSDDERDEEFFNIQVDGTGDQPYLVMVKVDGRPIEFEVDTGSRISTISEDFFRRNFYNKTVLANNINIRSYVGSTINSLGFINVYVTLGKVSVYNCKLYVIKNGGRPLLGREWVRALGVKNIAIDLQEINEDVGSDPFVSQLMCEFPEVFTEKLGTCKKTITLYVKDEKPVYVRARPVPLALRARVESELARLEREGIIYRVESSDYGTPIVPVVKECGDIRICGDYKITINPILKRDPYPLPRIEELFASLSGGEEYSKIDLKHSYQQCLLSDDSQRYTAITTHVGTFVYRRTPFGLSCIPEKFQKIMEETLRGVPNTVVFLDDVCVTGLRPDPNKLAAITEAPRPQNITQLKSFLGMLNYYGKFITNLSIMLQPLHALLKKDIDWTWDSRCEEAFIAAKNALTCDKVLAHYEDGRELILSVDSSAYGVGAVLAHRYSGGSERPISCVSRSLNSAERNYSQLDKEALAIYFGVTKHHQYLYGRSFILRTDHQPLSHIFGKKGGTPQTAASRLQRWAVRLSAYDFKVEFVRSCENGPADALSRLPLPCERSPTEALSYVDLVKDSLPVSFKDIAAETYKDKLLCKIKGYVLFGWPARASCEEEQAYFARKDEIIHELGCLIFKYRLVVPPPLRARVLEEIHQGHLGVNKMKSLARNYVYWPALDADIENLCRSCEACRVVRDAPPHATLHPWEFPLGPWQRVHADFAECGGVKYFILVDAFSKWIEVSAMKRTDTESTVSVLRSMFARFGLPSQLVTDNGPPSSITSCITALLKFVYTHNAVFLGCMKAV
ncbi:uncharacterized protein K02A2.6-like [Colias croceus]|uniref:uncharacterized protein K02A2.6-like n=1 Tax=Colias crocea TaxID=72248 RepID=UPI001E27E154|nr:uncharacterized protein K02A2.6-like [Colias croceus]